MDADRNEYGSSAPVIYFVPRKVPTAHKEVRMSLRRNLSPACQSSFLMTMR